MGYVVTGTALALRGVPYRNGGHDPSGFDCSGFVSYVFGQNGLPLPRTVSELYRTGRQVNGAIEPGDLVFFGSPIHHVGIYVGNGQMLDAPHTGTVVQIASMSGEGAIAGAARVPG